MRCRLGTTSINYGTKLLRRLLTLKLHLHLIYIHQTPRSMPKLFLQRPCSTRLYKSKLYKTVLVADVTTLQFNIFKFNCQSRQLLFKEAGHAHQHTSNPDIERQNFIPSFELTSKPEASSIQFCKQLEWRFTGNSGDTNLTYGKILYHTRSY